VEKILLNNLADLQGFQSAVGKGTAIDRAIGKYLSAIMFNPNAAGRTAAIAQAQGEIVAYFSDSVQPAATRLGARGAQNIIKSLPRGVRGGDLNDPAFRQRILFDLDARASDRLKIVQALVNDKANTLDNRLAAYWLEPGLNPDEKLANLRRIHTDMEERRRDYADRLNQFNSGEATRRPAAPRLDFVSRFNVEVKNDFMAQARRTGTDAETATFQAAGHKTFAWVTVNASEACPDCKKRQSVIGDVEFWEKMGKPGAGKTVCGHFCFCLLVPAETLVHHPALNKGLDTKGGGMTTPADAAALAARTAPESPPRTNEAAHAKLDRIFGPQVVKSDKWAASAFEGGNETIRQHQQDLALLPDSLLDKVAKKGVKINLNAESFGETYPEYGNMTPRGWPRGYTWKDVAGGYNDARKEVHAGTGNHGTDSLALHEFGHAIGDVLGVDDSAELIGHHQRLFSKLHPYAKQGGPGARAGRQEMWAMSVDRLVKVGRNAAVADYDAEYVTFLETKLEITAPAVSEGAATKGRLVSEGVARPVIAPAPTPRPALGTVVTDAKNAADIMADGALNTPFQSETARAYGRENAPPIEEIRNNWLKVFRSKKNTQAGLRAFDNLDPALIQTVQGAMNDNAANLNFSPMLDRFGQMPVVIRQMEVANTAAAEFRAGVTHVYQSKWAPKDVTLPLKVGRDVGTMEAGGGAASVLRHEYAHGVYERLPETAKEAWSAYWYENKDDMKNGVSTYASMKNPSEGFCETFAAMTHREYTPDHPAVNDATRRAVGKLLEALK
jgi:hypothetical protein